LKFPFLKRLNISSEVSRKLSLNLNNIVKGSDDVFLTPIGKDNDPDLLLKELDNLFSNARNISPDLLNLEHSNRLKFGPRSISLPWSDRKESLYDYFNHREDASCVELKTTNLKPSARPLSIANASRYLKPSTNSGLPFYCKKGSIIDSLVNDFESLINRKDPCVLFTRTQEGGKTRNVWGYPVADTLNEMRYYYPLFDYQSKLSWRSALRGPEHVDAAISSLMSRYSGDDVSYLSIDFTAYDASVGNNLQRKCFDYIKSYFQYQYWDDIDYIANRFNTIGIVSPDGVLSGSHGVPSGATFTNEVDSLAQYLVYSNCNIDKLDYQIQGDDGAYALKDNQINSLFSEFKISGLNANESKSYVSKNYIVFLQRLYDKYYMKNGFIGGIYPLYRALNRIIYQERYSDFMDYSLKGVDYYSIRTITILENCKHHPLFKEFVRFIWSKDKFKLRFNAGSVEKYNRMSNSGTGTAGFLNNQFGDNILGIYSFETIKVIREIAL
jgi:hypothetical protein